MILVVQVYTLQTNKKIFGEQFSTNLQSNSVLKKISRTVLKNAHIDNSQRDIYRAAGLNNRLYLDSMLSPSFFLDHFKSTFGEIGYYIERAGILFACFMLIKFLIDVVIFILRAFEIQKLSKNKTLNFWKTLLGASYNLFLLSIVTSIYRTPKDDENSDNNTNNEPNRRPMVDEETKVTKAEEIFFTIRGVSRFQLPKNTTAPLETPLQ